MPRESDGVFSDRRSGGRRGGVAVPLTALTKDELPAWREQAPGRERDWVGAIGYRRAGQGRAGAGQGRPARARPGRGGGNGGGDVGARRVIGDLAGGELPARHGAGRDRCEPRRARLGARHLCLHPLPRQEAERGAARVARGRGLRPGRASGGGRVPRPRPDLDPGLRYGPRGIGGGGGHGRGGGGRAMPGHRRRRPVARELYDDPHGRARQHAGAAAGRHHLGRSGGAQGDIGRQGGVLRYGRLRPQGRRRHAQHEEGHGGVGDRARARPGDHGGGAQGAAAGDDAVRREFGVGQCLPPARCGPDAQGADGGGRQYRRRGAADPVRRAGRGGRARSRR